MRSFAFLLIVVFLFLTAAFSVTIPSQQIIAKATYEINLQSNHEIQIALLDIKNELPEPVTTFIHVVHESLATKVAFVKAYLADKPDSPFRATRFTPDFDQYPHLPRTHLYYAITYPTPIPSQANVQLFVRTGFHRTLVPFPASITQGQKQRVLYTGLTNFFAVYPIHSYTTTVYTESSNIDSWTPRRNSEKKNNSIVYGLVDVAHPKPFDTGDELTVHAKNHSPFYSFTNAVRLFDLGAEGNVSVSENYYVEHIGAKLAGPFHRSLHDRANYYVQRGEEERGPEIRSFQAFLPDMLLPGGVTFRDFNGNISTSRILYQKDATVVDFELRYPLYGGWKSDFELAYDYLEPSLAAPKISGSEQLVSFTMPYGYPFNDATGDVLEIKILLPEGATDLHWTVPFEIETAFTSTVTSYKDVIGRTQLTLRSANVIPNMWDLINVTYKLPTSSTLLSGPPRFVYFVALLLGAFFIVAFGNFSLGHYPVQPETNQGNKEKNVKFEDETNQEEDGDKNATATTPEQSSPSQTAQTPAPTQTQPPPQQSSTSPPQKDAKSRKSTSKK